jgi:hypothetical protein
MITWPLTLPRGRQARVRSRFATWSRSGGLYQPAKPALKRAAWAFLGFCDAEELELP